MAVIFRPDGKGRWTPAEAGEVSVDNVGRKALGLLKLPLAWRPDFVVLSADLCERLPAGLGLARDVLRALGRGRSLIVRSSVSDESIDARGRYVSRVCSGTPGAVARAIADTYAENRARLTEAVGEAGRCASIVQPYLDARAKGHLSNEHRHAQRNVDFLYEVESCVQGAGLETDRPVSFKLPRPLRKPRPTILHVSQADKALPATLKTVAAWLASTLDRGHAEWVLSEGRLWVVQCDEEPIPASFRPLQEWTERASGVFSAKLNAFRVRENTDHFDRWRKTGSHRLIAEAGLRVPPIYVLDNRADVSELLAGRVPRGVDDDLRAFVQMPAMVRLDVSAGHEDWKNLPARGPFTDAERARAALIEMLQDAAAREVPPDDLAVIVHHFVPAKASAWATASPCGERIQVDATWGLPDGLQAFPYDTYYVNVANGRVDRVPRYKDEFVDLDAQGNTIARRSPPPLARKGPLDDQSASRVAQGTLAIARARGRAMSVMWFLLVDPRAEVGSELPWIATPAEEESGIFRDEELAQTASMIAAKVKLGLVRRLRTRSDLAAFRANPAPFDLGGRSVLFRPSGDLVRDRPFLREVAAAFSQQPDWYLVLEGSVLSHTPYQLRDLGAKRIVSLGEFVRPARRTKIGKLVRDRIPESISAKGEEAIAAELPEREREKALRAKLVEEALEVFHSGSARELREELADVLAVLRDLARGAGLPWSDVESGEVEKRAKRGGFERGLLLSMTGRLLGDSPDASGVEPRDPIRRLRHETGVAISLVPPFRTALERDVMGFTLDGIEVQLSVRYESDRVVVVISKPGLADDSNQLSLFD